MAPLEPQEKGFALADWHLKSCAACGIRCLPGVVSKRLGLLLSSLSLCLRFGSLTQFPPTLDLYRFAIACRGGFAGARRSTHYQDDMHCQMIRLYQNKMSRAAADDRSRPNRIAMLTRLRRAQGSAIGKHRTSARRREQMQRCRAAILFFYSALGSFAAGFISNAQMMIARIVFGSIYVPLYSTE